MKILSINPGSTSTKIGIFENENELFSKTLRHDASDISKFANIIDQLDFRKQVIIETINESGIKIHELDAIVGRGGLLKPIASGCYSVNENMLKDLKSGDYGFHASSLGAILAYEIAKNDNKPSYIVDPVVVDELIPEARISGHPLFKRVSIFHALNQKAIAKQYAKDMNTPYCELNLVVAHLGGGISVGAHQQGKVIDVNNALGGEGPFSPDRSGTLPANALIELCFTGKMTKNELLEVSVGKGGMVGFFGTNDFAKIMKDINQPETKLIIDGLIMQIAKQIGSACAVLKGKVDAILLTGGLAYSEYLTSGVAEYCSAFAKVVSYPGEDELKALAVGALRVLTKEEDVKEY